jgi:hypothetical protein
MAEFARMADVLDFLQQLITVERERNDILMGIDDSLSQIAGAIEDSMNPVPPNPSPAGAASTFVLTLGQAVPK